MGEGSEDEFFEISAAANLTGLSTHVLRVWEKRYGVVEPYRNPSGRRQYRRTDLHRLSILKALVDCGHTISSIAKLEISLLEERLSEARLRPLPEADKVLSNCRVGFVGVQSRYAVREAADTAVELSLVAEFLDFKQLMESLKPGVLDFLIVDATTLFVDDFKEIQRVLEFTGASRGLVIYQFAQSDALKLGGSTNITAIRGPVTATEILISCPAEVYPPKRQPHPEQWHPTDSDPIPQRLFSSEQLYSVSKMTSVLRCECPHHLAKILENLFAFEEYSKKCENLDEDDAAMHAFLHRETANCRLRMEQALQKLMNSEGIEI